MLERKVYGMAALQFLVPATIRILGTEAARLSAQRAAAETPQAPPRPAPPKRLGERGRGW